MIEIAPEIISTFEPREKIGIAAENPPSAKKISSLLWGLNAIRTYFQNSGKSFWRPRQIYSPSIRACTVEDRKPKHAA